MDTLTVALLQLTPCDSLETSRIKGDEACRRAAALGADIALFPEMWSTGYTFCESDDPAAVEAWRALAVGPDDPYMRHFKALARELDMAIALTYLERWADGVRNSVSLINRHGEIVLTYAKVQTCEFDKEAILIPGEDFPVCALDTRQGEVKIGAMICMDREFPEPARILMLHGAEIILIPNSCDMEENRTGQLRARAFENMVGVALANYAAPKNDGHSVAFDSMAFSRDERPRDTTLIRAGEHEGIYLAVFDVDALREYRAREVWGNAFRRPRLYGALTATEVHPPFVRSEATR